MCGRACGRASPLLPGRGGLSEGGAVREGLLRGLGWGGACAGGEGAARTQAHRAGGVCLHTNACKRSGAGAAHCCTLQCCWRVCGARGECGELGRLRAPAALLCSCLDPPEAAPEPLLGAWARGGRPAEDRGVPAPAPASPACIACCASGSRSPPVSWRRHGAEQRKGCEAVTCTHTELHIPNWPLGCEEAPGARARQQQCQKQPVPAAPPTTELRLPARARAPRPSGQQASARCMPHACAARTPAC